MDSRPLNRFKITNAGVSYTSSQLTPPTVPERLFAAKFNSRSSPNSPFSTPFDSENAATQSDSLEQQCSTENLSGLSPSCRYYHSSPSSSDSARESSFTSSSGAFLQSANGGQSMKHALLRLESALMGPDNEEDEVIRPEPRTVQHGDPSGNLKQLLVDCACALSESRFASFDKMVEEARSLVSISGEPIQRVGAYLIEGLVARKHSSGTNIYRALRCKEPLGKDLLSFMHILYEVCPYLKFGYMAANGAIAEACRNEDAIHIIDFQIAQGTQWMTLLQALAARPGGPPRVRITGIDDPVSKYARGTSLEAVGKRLGLISEKFGVPVEFHPVPVFAAQVTRDMLGIRAGEALAVNFPLQLHHTPDESVDVGNPRDELIRMVKSLSPKVTTLVEQESNTNTTPLVTRFVETLDYYSAMFESIDVTMARERKERINVEQHCLAKDIVNIIACEGKERVERHELLGKWKSRFTMAGFRPFPLSSYVNSVIRGLLRCYSEHYTLVEMDGAMLLGWKNRMLISASAWH